MPCRERLPQFEALYKKWHKDGLEIIGINFDEKGETGQKLCKSIGQTYPQVWVPSDQTTRVLWGKASDIGSLPRVLLIDRAGILRADCHADQLEQEIAKLIKHPEGGR